MLLELAMPSRIGPVCSSDSATQEVLPVILKVPRCQITAMVGKVVIMHAISCNPALVTLGAAG